MGVSVGIRASGPAQQETAPASRRLSREGWIVLGLTALGALLRFATIRSQSFWFDEAQLAHEARLSLGGLFNTLGAQETSPPLYFVLAWAWAKVFGTGEAGLRSLSALGGTALIPVTYLCGRELVSRRAGTVAAALVAVSPFMIWYAQEAREYMLLALLSGGSLLFFARSLSSRGNRDIGWWALLSVLAILTHFFAGFLIVPEALVLLWRSRTRIVIAAVAAVAIVQIALVPLAIADTGHPIGWITGLPLSTRIQQVPVTFALNTLYRSSLLSSGLLAGAIALAATIFLIVGGAGRRELQGAGWAAALAAVVLVVPLLAAVAGHDFFIARALIPAWVPLAVVLGAACTARRWPVSGAAFAVLLLGAFVYGTIKIGGDHRYQRPDWRGVAAALGPASRRRAVIAYDGALATDPLKIYLAGAPWRQPTAPVTVSEVDVIASPWQVPRAPLPAGVRILAHSTLPGFAIARFAIRGGWRGTPASIAARAGTLLGPEPADPAVLIEQAIA